MPNPTPNRQALSDAFMERLHPEFDLYGIDAANDAVDQVEDIASRVLAASGSID